MYVSGSATAGAHCIVSTETGDLLSVGAPLNVDSGRRGSIRPVTAPTDAFGVCRGHVAAVNAVDAHPTIQGCVYTCVYVRVCARV